MGNNKTNDSVDITLLDRFKRPIKVGSRVIVTQRNYLTVGTVTKINNSTFKIKDIDFAGYVYPYRQLYASYATHHNKILIISEEEFNNLSSLMKT